MDNIIEILNEIINYTIYESNKLNTIMNIKLDTIINFLNKSNNLTKDINSILSIKNNKNKIFLDRYICIILSKTNLDFNTIIEVIKTDIPLNIKYILWNKLNVNNKINYLLENNITSDNLYLLNMTISNKNNKLYQKIIQNEKVLKKLKNITPNINLISKEDLTNASILNIIDSKTISNYIMKYYYTYKDFKKLLKENISLIINSAKYSLDIINIDKDDLNKLVLDYPIIISKFNTAISINNFNIDTLNYLLNIVNDQDILTSIKELLIVLDYKNINKYFNIEFIKNQKDFNLSIYPFNNIDLNLTNKIIYNYNYLKKFTYDTIINIINNLYNEDDKITILRNEDFINDIPSYYLVKMLNKMKFKNVFNMLQNIKILNKVNNLNIKLEELDKVFISSYLDSPTLVNICNHEMIYNMLLLDDNISTYIKYPYINSKLNNTEIIDILILKNINIFKTNITKILSSFEIKNYLNKMLIKYNINYDLLFNDYVFNNYLNINIESLNKDDIDNIKYLFDKIYTKGNTTMQCYTLDIEAFKSIVSSYLLLGFNNTNKLFENGTYNITFRNINKLKNIYINKLKKEIKFLNIEKITNLFSKYLNKINISNISEVFIKNYLLEIPELNKYIELFINTSYFNINNIVQFVINYLDYYAYDKDSAHKLLYNFIKNFNIYYKEKWFTELKNRFNNLTKNNCKLNYNVLYKTEKAIDEYYTSKYKLATFIEFLKSNNKNSYSKFFNINIDNVTTKYLKFIKSKYTISDIINKILIKEDNINLVLNKLGYRTPIFYNLYKEINNEKISILELNDLLTDKLNKMHTTRVLTILNYICYDTILPFSLDKELLDVINNIKNRIINFNGKVDVNKLTNKLEYTNIFSFDNIEELEIYDNKYQEIERIIEYTKKFSNKYIINEEIKAKYKNYYRYNLNTYIKDISVNKYNYHLIKRNLFLDDFKKIFSGFKLNNIPVLTLEQKEFLVNNLVFVAMGYCDDFTINFGNTLNNIKPDTKYNNIYDLIFKK